MPRSTLFRSTASRTAIASRKLFESSRQVNIGLTGGNKKIASSLIYRRPCCTALARAFQEHAGLACVFRLTASSVSEQMKLDAGVARKHGGVREKHDVLPPRCFVLHLSLFEAFIFQSRKHSQTRSRLSNDKFVLVKLWVRHWFARTSCRVSSRPEFSRIFSLWN